MVICGSQASPSVAARLTAAFHRCCTYISSLTSVHSVREAPALPTALKRLRGSRGELRSC